MYMDKDTRDGVIEVPLCNFTAKITRENVYDDGAEKQTVFNIAGFMPNGEPLPEIEVPAEKYPSMNWITAHWGTRAVVYAGQGTKDHLRVAIQTLSGSVPRKTIYRHVGWRNMDGRWIFLHGDGGIGPEGPVKDIWVELHEGLDAYRLPEPLKGDVDLNRLTQVQKKAAKGMYAGLMAAYLEWLSPQLDRLRQDFQHRFEALRHEALQFGLGHTRTPEILASLAGGWALFLQFAQLSGAIDRQEQQSFWETGWQILVEVARKQTVFYQDEEPTHQFLTLVQSVLNSGRGHLAPTCAGYTFKSEEEAANYGWRLDHGAWQPLGELIGWFDGEEIYLEPEMPLRWSKNWVGTREGPWR
jgi:hypothetical protein